mmetsp:Transcript_12466/g.23955  ORF Transcript_12466/g.23955 Transcript_12466/m.23955 type:complete len:268 (+) Transcript_12466:244-1047(+)|eukprot:CAMPEP_0172660124 /NCGR_PEP_ID=MMETSP1074-20121228/3903_1 /TAXON_ID=2916 /ORGANISM="Ceratium fusus, Strain PA161109" /LENGTH=267 /DNA_ID=CAMNT_0013475729 /DNA_START=177 /DNA_END=980 /DNA_ORIENTATION=-
MEGNHEATLCLPCTATVGFMKRQLGELLSVPIDELKIMLGLRAVGDGETLITLGMPTELKMARAHVHRHEPGTSLLHIALAGEEQKFDSLLMLVTALSGTAQLLVYCNDRTRVLRLTRQLEERGISVAVQHGDLDQLDKELALEAFHSGAAQVMTLTDAAPPRFVGDLDPAPVIVNYDLPRCIEDFGQRVFRSGRCGTRMVAISLSTPATVDRLRDAERFYNVRVTELPTTDDEAVLERLALARRLVPEGHAERFHRSHVRERPWVM